MVADRAVDGSAFADLCLGMYVLVDELWARVGPWYRRPGPAPACSDEHRRAATPNC